MLAACSFPEGWTEVSWLILILQNCTKQRSHSAFQEEWIKEQRRAGVMCREVLSAKQSQGKAASSNTVQVTSPLWVLIPKLLVTSQGPQKQYTQNILKNNVCPVTSNGSYHFISKKEVPSTLLSSFCELTNPQTHSVVTLDQKRKMRKWSPQG